MTLDRDDVQLINAMISRALNMRQPAIGRDAVALTGSHNPKDGTVGAILADTMTMFAEDGDQSIAHPKVPVAQTIYGDQYGVRGNERMTVFPTQHGFDALFTYDEDDSPGAAAGEIWRVHRNASGAVDSSSKWTNDGPTPGDGLGGHVHVAGALHSVATTGGLTTTHNDSTKQITHKANATTYTLVDGQGNAIAHVASQVGVGDKFANLDATRAAFANADATTLTNNLRKAIGNVAQQMAQAAISAGVTNAAAWLTAIQAGLPSLSFTDITSSVASVTVPPGSSIVRVK